MYTKFFGLSRRPFEERADPQFYFPTSHGDEVLASLEYESQSGQSIALLIGEAGTGKTLLMRSLLMRGKPSDQSVVLTWAAGGQSSVIREACKAFGVTLPTSFSAGRGLARMRRHLKRVTTNGRRALLVIDQAEHLSHEQLEEISELTSLHLCDQSMLTVMLAGQPQFKALLDRAELSSLRQRLFGERVLVPFSSAETEAYIAHRVKVAGAANADLFERSAIEVIHRVSGGIPRLINHVAGEAMLGAYGASRKTVTESVVLELVKEHAYAEPMPTTAPSSETAAVDLQGGMGSKAESGTGVVRSASLSRDRLEVEGDPLFGVGEPATDHAADVGYGVGSGMILDQLGGVGLESLNPLEGGDQGGMMVDRGHLLLENLERALARAERMSTTSQAALAQSTAVETHLETLVGHAQRIAVELGGSVTRANDSLSTLNARIRSEVSTAQDRMAVTHERLAELPGILETADHKVAHLQDACANAEHVETSLRQFGEQLADQADTVQERISVAVTGTQAGQEALDRASKLIETMQREEANHEQSSRRAGDQIDAKLRTLNQSLSKAERIKEELLHKSINHFEATLQKSLDRIAASQLEAWSATQRTSDEALSKADRAIASLAAQTENMLTEANRIKDDLLHKSMEHFEGKLEKVLDRFCVAQLEAINAMESRETELRSQVSGLEARAEVLQRMLRTTGQKVDAMQKRSTDVATDCKKSLAQISVKEQRVAQLGCDLDSSIERGEAHKTEMQCATGKAEALQRGVAAMLVDIGAAQERAVAAAAQIEGHKAIVSNIEQAVQQGQSATSDLDAVVSHVGQLQSDVAEIAQKAALKTEQFRSGVDQVEREAEATIARIEQAATERTEQMQRDVAVVTEEASATTQQFRSGVEQVEREAEATVTHIAQAAIERTQRTQNDIAAVVEEASVKTEAFQSRVGQVERVAEATIERIAEVTKERTEQLKGEVAQVAEEACAKTEVFRAGVCKVQVEADETIARIAQAVAQGSDAIGSVSAEAQTKVTQLDSHNAAARVVLQELSDMNRKGHGLLDEANALLDDLGDKTKHVESTIESLWGLAGGAEVQTKALERKQQEIESMAARLAGEVQGAQAMLGKLSEQSSGADAQGKIIATRCQDAKKIADRLVSISKLLKTAKDSEQSITEMVDGASRVADDLSSAANASDQLLTQFSRQGEGISATLSHLEARAAKIEAAIVRSTEKPAELVRSAQTQTAQLERVCGAVRKVFSSLSKTTLEAKKQTDSCGQISTKATQQIRSLRAETDRSSKTLREWIAEAIRVQTRLERTLDQAPSIRQTHPIEPLANVSDRTTIGDAIAEPLAGGELTMLGEPEGEGGSDWSATADAPRSAPADLAGIPGNRADEISRLLADAKNLVPQRPN